MKKYYFTFGSGSPLAKYYVKIEAEDEYHARALMICMFSRHWASVYKDIPETTDMFLLYDYKQLDVVRQCSTPLKSNHDEIDQTIYKMAYTSGKVVCRP